MYPERYNKASRTFGADQMLLSDFFGMESTRAPGKERSLKALTLKRAQKIWKPLSN
jgi:hypothetical protein